MFTSTVALSGQKLRQRSSGGILGAIIAAVLIVLILCCIFMLFRRRRTANTRALQTGTRKPLFGGLWRRRRQPAPVHDTGTIGKGYGDNVTVPPPAYGKDGYVAYPPV